MERTGVTPPGAVAASDLAEVLQGPGPYFTVYLTTEAGIDNAAYRSEQRWKNLRGELADAGAPEEVLTAIDPLVGESHQQGQMLAVIADAEGVLHVEHGPQAPPRDRAVVGPVPPLLPLIAVRQGFPTHLTVLADRAGADITLHRHGRPELHREAGGDDFPIRRVSPGGWSQRRFQQRAENTWESNADDVAAEISSLVDRHKPRLIVLAGDVRAVEMLQKALPAAVAELVVVVDGGRSEDGSGDRFAEAVREHVSALVNNDIADLLGKFREELGQDDRAADGPDATLAALTRAQVEVLLVADSPDDERTALFGPAPNQVGREADTLRSMGVDDPGTAPLVDVAVRAALGTGAAVEVVPAGDVPTGRLGAILRWS
ncbi:MAG: Vms1/Ankzf1 family peptidyl-tRNA hydrolase [Acidimicrobiia bacterium]